MVQSVILRSLLLHKGIDLRKGERNVVVSETYRCTKRVRRVRLGWPVFTVMTVSLTGLTPSRNQSKRDGRRSRGSSPMIHVN